MIRVSKPFLHGVRVVVVEPPARRETVLNRRKLWRVSAGPKQPANLRWVVAQNPLQIAERLLNNVDVAARRGQKIARMPLLCGAYAEITYAELAQVFSCLAPVRTFLLNCRLELLVEHWEYREDTDSTGGGFVGFDVRVEPLQPMFIPFPRKKPGARKHYLADADITAVRRGYREARRRLRDGE